MIKGMPEGDKKANKFDKTLLDEATHRHLSHYMLILDLDLTKLGEEDMFEAWAARCGAEVRVSEEGGAVVRRGGEEKGGFIFISPDQYSKIESELAELQQLLRESK